ncbi:hypothetical protein ACIBI4_10990 [Streptomyces sp. NPDC050418]|uniref:hypothetical protein n=1 Tax=Streptomyces sp. NPDC050418 TaxID=3365612 RepID=UPI0037B8135F
MGRRASRLVLCTAVAVAAYAGPTQGDRNPQQVEQRTAAQCAEQIEVLNEARFEASADAVAARRAGRMVDTTFAVDASCSDAIDADTERCRREADEVMAGLPPDKRPRNPGTYPPPGDEPADDFDAYELLSTVDGFPAECDWAVLDALTGRWVTGMARP